MRAIAAPFLAAVLSLEAGGGLAADRPPPHLHQQWLTATLACRGGAVTEKASEHGCERREAVERKLAAIGWCFGRRGRGGAHAAWHRC